MSTPGRTEATAAGATSSLTMSGSSCRRDREERLAGLDRLALGERCERDPAVLRRADDLLGVHLALHAQPVQLAARRAAGSRSRRPGAHRQTALGLAGLDVALDPRRRAAGARQPALLRADLVALLRRLLARQIAFGRGRGDVVALRRSGWRAAARPSACRRAASRVPRAGRAGGLLEHQPVDRRLLARGVDLALDRSPSRRRAAGAPRCARRRLPRAAARCR